MQIYPINNNQNPNFGHSFKVSICVKNPNSKGYEYISPAKNTKLYKELNSRIVGWLNTDFLANIRKVIDEPNKNPKKRTLDDIFCQMTLSKALAMVDSDYREFAMVRSVYDKYKLGHIVTGVDVPVVENLKGATQIGIAKNDALIEEGTVHTDEVKKIVEMFDYNANKYVQDPTNILRSKKGKEMMLKINFRNMGKNKKHKDIYELENFEFYEIQKSKAMKNVKRKYNKDNLYTEILKTFSHIIDKMTNKFVSYEQFMELMQSKTSNSLNKTIKHRFYSGSARTQLLPLEFYE